MMQNNPCNVVLKFRSVLTVLNNSRNSRWLATLYNHDGCFCIINQNNLNAWFRLSFVRIHSCNLSNMNVSCDCGALTSISTIFMEFWVAKCSIIPLTSQLSFVRVSVLISSFFDSSTNNGLFDSRFFNNSPISHEFCREFDAFSAYFSLFYDNFFIRRIRSQREHREFNTAIKKTIVKNGAHMCQLNEMSKSFYCQNNLTSDVMNARCIFISLYI